MWAFNLFRCPPLDGGRILVGLLPVEAGAVLLARLEPWGFFIVMGARHPRRGQRLLAAPTDGVLGYDLLNLLNLTHLPAPKTAVQAHRRPPPASSPASPPPARPTWAILSAPSGPRCRPASAPTCSSFYFLADYHALIKCDEPARIQQLHAGDRGQLAGRRAGPGARDLLPPVRHPRDPRADLAADLRHRQGRAEPRPCLQGLGRQERGRRQRPGRRRHRRASSCTRC